jgi:hypothetical protein
MWTEIVVTPPRSDRVRFRLASYGDRQAEAMIYKGYHFWLENRDQRDVTRLTCIGMFDDMPDAAPPSLSDIRASLGRYASLELAPAG